MIWLCWYTSRNFLLCSCTGNQDCKHRNNNQQTQMFKAESHILDKVKRVSGRRVIIRTVADTRGQLGEGTGSAWGSLLPAVKPALLPHPQGSRWWENNLSIITPALRSKDVSGLGQSQSIQQDRQSRACAHEPESQEGSPTQNQSLILQKCLKGSLQPSHLGLG